MIPVWRKVLLVIEHANIPVAHCLGVIDAIGASSMIRSVYVMLATHMIQSVLAQRGGSVVAWHIKRLGSSTWSCHVAG